MDVQMVERLAAIEAIRQVKARYFRGVDDRNSALVRSILAEDCLLDYRGCCTDPASGVDHLPAMNRVMEGRASWPDAPKSDGPHMITIHQGHDPDISIESDTSASGIWAFTDRLFLPPGGPFTRLTGWGRYHETYVRDDEGWKLRTTRIERLRVEVA